MNTILLRINKIYSNMGRGEKKIADWVMENQQKVIFLSISKLADECKCSESTIVRFSQRLGLSGFQELKISMAQEINVASVLLSNVISGNNPCIEIFVKQAEDILKSLEHTMRMLDGQALEQAAKAISKANQIAIFGLGNSASIAIHAQYKFMRGGMNSTAYLDNHIQLIAASNLKKGDIAISIANDDLSSNLANVMRCARKNGATTICITNFNCSSILKESQIVLYAIAGETDDNLVAVSSQSAIIDSIYTYNIVNGNELRNKFIKK